MALSTQTFTFNDQSKFMTRDLSVQFTFDPHAPLESVSAHDLTVHHMIVLPNPSLSGNMVPYDRTTHPRITPEVDEALKNLFGRTRAAGGVDSAYLAANNWAGWKTTAEKYITHAGPIGRDEGLAHAVPQAVVDVVAAAKLVARVA